MERAIEGEENDQLALGDDVDQAARTWLEPVTVLAAVAGAIATVREAPHADTASAAARAIAARVTPSSY